MMKTTLKILGVHGLGDHRQSPWKDQWQEAILKVFPMQERIELQFDFMTYDDIMEKMDVSPLEAALAIGKLLRSGISSLRRRRGMLGNVDHWLKWSAGYVVKWVESEPFQKRTRGRMLETIREVKPDLLLCHSLGSLISYNALSHPEAFEPEIASVMKKMSYVTLGSQIGNPFVVGNLTPGRIEPLRVKQWYHLYNAEDDVFTAPIRLWDADNFLQVDTFFDIKGFADHSAVEYLSHRATVQQVWEPMVRTAVTPKSKAKAAASKSLFTPLLAGSTSVGRREPRKRALLIGINDYPNPADRLDGCVNDTFRMSAVLQECGFDASDIRVCLDERATAAGILERMEWLFEDPIADDTLVFYYSGHGAQLSTYGYGDSIDRMDETLVPYDFDWSPEKCVTDDQIFALYSQLPYDTRAVMIFDCCHSGGIHRSSPNKIRGLNPPDDIRHRALQWDKRIGMWKPRDIKALNKTFSAKGDKHDPSSKYFGDNGTTTRLGRASAFRQMSNTAYEELKSQRKDRPVGPFLPIIFEACQEHEYAYEYRHGTVSYGAFTYAITEILRNAGPVTFNQLLDKTTETLRDRLKYDQTPQILGPNPLLNTKVPWLGQKTPARKKTKNNK